MCFKHYCSSKKNLNDDLSKIKSCVKLTGFVNSIDSFTEQPKVINGASDTIVKIFGDKVCILEQL